jgi:hypothetical protein
MKALPFQDPGRILFTCGVRYLRLVGTKKKTKRVSTRGTNQIIRLFFSLCNFAGVMFSNSERQAQKAGAGSGKNADYLGK